MAPTQRDPGRHGLSTAIPSRPVDSAASRGGCRARAPRSGVIRVNYSGLLWVLSLLLVLCPLAAAETDSVTLRIHPASAHHAEIVALKDGTFSILTTGVDPFVSTLTLTEGEAPADAVVVGFEYFCPDGLDHLEVFFGPPIRAGASATLGALPAAEVWRSAAVNLRTSTAGQWKGDARQFRLDFGSKPGIRLQIRNLQLRRVSPEETEKDRRITLERKGKEDDANAIRAYLNREFPGRIDAVRCDGTGVTVEGWVPEEAGAELHLAELQMHEEPWRENPRLHTSGLYTGPGGFFRAVLPRHADGRDRLFSRWQLVRKGGDGETLLSHARHAADANPTAAAAPSQTQARKTKKGMGGVILNAIAGELQEMGVEHVTVNIVLNRLFETGAGPDTLAHSFEGRTYRVNRNALANTDKTLSFFSRFADVSAILLVAIPKNSGVRSPLAHPESGAPGIFAMPDLTTQEGSHAYRAALAFLAERYAGGPHGRITHWILHNEIDQAFTWTNMGEQPMDVVMDHYVRSMRIASLSARQFNPSAKVFISLTHHWTAPEADSLQNYRPRDMLDRLGEYSRVEGDFEWGVAYHPYPQNLFESATWNDKRAHHSFDSPYITLKNIEVLDAYLHRKPLLQRGLTPRTVLLSEQGFHTRDYSAPSQQLQAAALVYTWHKIRQLPTIEAFHHHRWIDAADEGGLLLGLRTLPDADKPFGVPKTAWNVYSDLDTPREATSSAFAREILGVTDFAQIPFRGRITGDKADH